MASSRTAFWTAYKTARFSSNNYNVSQLSTGIFYMVVYAEKPEKFKLTSQDKVQKYRPPYISSRIQNQSGLFTVHNKPDEVFIHDNLKKVIIPQGIKRDIKKKLFKFGVNQRMIYPGLEGITRDLKWLETKIY